MKGLVERIYNDILACEEGIVRIDSEASRKIMQIAERHTGLSEGEREKLKALLYEAAFEAEHAGIKVGIRFTLDLLLSVYGG